MCGSPWNDYQIGAITGSQGTIETLTDNSLLEIFNFYVDENGINAWYRLLRVCQRWRYIIFASPLRLHLKLLCSARTPVREMLGIWPALPITIQDYSSPASLIKGADNIIAALEHSDRVWEISLRGVPSWILERFVAAMQVPFPELRNLVLRSNDEMARMAPVLLPRSFLGGSAPHLRSCVLENLPFPALRKLLLSASHLVDLRLVNIPHSGYISPEAMVTCLSALTSLKSLYLAFHSPQSRPNRAIPRLPPLTRTVLPALTDFDFRGVCEYLEDFFSMIDAPLLQKVLVKFFHQLIFDVSQLHRFILRTERLRILNEADVVFYNGYVVVRLSPQRGTFDPSRLTLSISCSKSDWQLSSLAQICSSSLPPLSTLQRLEIREDRPWRPHWEDGMENAQWLELLHPFIAVKNLYLSEELAQRVAPALQELDVERATYVLPALKNLFLRRLQGLGPIQDAISQFAAARKLSNHPVAVESWYGGW